MSLLRGLRRYASGGCRVGVLLLAAQLIGCDGERELPPFGQATIHVDTDLPVPTVVARLRIDLYTRDGRWFESRDIARPDPRDWPVSFTVYSEDEQEGREVWVRLRAYPEARTRDYRGEQFWQWGTPRELPPLVSPQPRLIAGSRDITPVDEPLPWLSVDRLVRVALTPGSAGNLDVTLFGNCVGTMARLADGDGVGPALGIARSCVASERFRSDVVAEAPGSTGPIGQSLVGTLRAGDCGEEGNAEQICVPGGATLLGRSDLSNVPDLPTAPERVVTHASFLMDRQEVTVGRFRAALTQGFAPTQLPALNDGPLGNAPDPSSCSYSSSPMGREDYALSCVNAVVAAEFCMWAGGSLPTEAMWEYAATRGTGVGRSLYPWGDEAPSCQRAVYGRAVLAGLPGVCASSGNGPAPVGVAPEDRTPSGILGLAGGVAEWTRDTRAAYDDACWNNSSMHDASCQNPDASDVIVRGGSWPAPPPVLKSAIRVSVTASSPASFIGFRCVYPVAPT